MIIENEIMSAATHLLEWKEIATVARDLSAEEPSHVVKNAFLPEDLAGISRDLRDDPGWRHEYWVLNENDDVELTGRAGFDRAEAKLKFSNNECLRKPLGESRHLLSTLAAFRSREVLSLFSETFGEPLRLCSVESTRYRSSEFLRRHQDLFEDRRFAVICYFSDKWEPGCGGELVVEGVGGAARVVAPHPGDLAIVAFRPGAYHQVAKVQQAGWARYSIAAHYGRVTQ
jgi:Rps23 Pro-64 3,4-dihydroxylase Tpa1-like proline 4-hydroxylase